MTNAPANRQGRRERTLGLLLSGCAHALVLLVLSLIAIQNAGLGQHSMLMSDAGNRDANLQQLQEFVLEPMQEPLAVASPATSDAAVPVVKLQLPPPQATTPSWAQQIAEISSLIVDDAGPQPATMPTELGLDGTESVAVDRVAVAKIQSRVGKAGGRQGEVQFALAWKDINDLDLHVIVPEGERISFEYRRSRCHGILDVDMNVKGESEEPVENVRWTSNAPWGRFTVLVHKFQVHQNGRQPSEFELLANLGEEIMIQNGSVSLRDRIAIYRFRYVPQHVPEFQRNQLRNELELLQEMEERLAGPMLEAAQQEPSGAKQDRLLNVLISKYPHTDAAIAAMQLLGGNTAKQ